MLDKYDLLVEQEAGEKLKRLRGNRRRAVFDFIEMLGRDPFIDGGIQFEDRKGRRLQKVSISGVVIAFHVDHAVKEVKIMKLNAV